MAKHRQQTRHSRKADEKSTLPPKFADQHELSVATAL